MTPISKPIIFFGTEDFSAQFLEALLDGGYSVRLVVTKPDTKKGRGHTLSPPQVKSVAQQRNIPVLQPEKLSDIREAIVSIGDDVAGVLVSYGKIIPQSIIDLFTPGIINVHPSLLPLYRGPSPVESAILHGDSETGVSIMQLSKDMDAGPVYSQATMSLDHTETKPQLYQALARLGIKELCHVLPQILEGSLQPTAQDHAKATYCSLLSKKDSLLHPAELTATEAERHVRAFLGFPRTKIKLGEQTVIVIRAHLVSKKETPLDVMFADEKFLSIDELIAPSGKAMSTQEFLRGYSL